MKIKYYSGGENNGCWTNALYANLINLSRNSKENSCLFVGIKTLQQKKEKIVSLSKKYKKNFFFLPWGPSVLFDGNFHKYLPILETFDCIFCTSKFLVDFFKKNSVNINIKYVKSPYIINTNRFSKLNLLNKYYDLFYAGGIYSQDHFQMLKTFKKYKYIFTSLNRQRFFPRLSLIPFFIKQYNLKNIEDVLNFQSQAKIGICINQLFPNKYQMETFSSNNQIEIFNNSKTKIFPELKDRIFSYSLTKTLMLVKSDSFNIIEEYFIPGKEFLYYKDVLDLEKKVKDIINNYNNYKQIIENAYKKVQLFTPEKFYKKIINLS
jgi:spore maturation protein CgeB